MGREIEKKVYTQRDFIEFEKRCLDELGYIETLFKKGKNLFSNAYCVGYELEVCILDDKNRPNPINKELLEEIGSSLLTSELAKYDLEINGNVFELKEGVVPKVNDDISQLWNQASTSAQKLNAQLGLFGILPSLKLKHFNKHLYQSEMYRYTLISRRVRELRHESLEVTLHGKDEVSLKKDDVMLEALSTSLQIHLQIPFDKSVEYYHAALIASVVLVGFGANSPLVLGKRLWHESRIAIFEQSVDTRDRLRREHGDEKRVHFAEGYIDSWLELFEANDKFKILFADLQDRPTEELYHFNLHNGTVWRWIRPILDKDKNGKHTLRLELRILPSGPTLIDTQSNLWFFITLIEGLVKSDIDLQKVPFETLKNDFYSVAKKGLETEFHNPIDGQKVKLQEWILDEGLRLAKKGTESFDIRASHDYLEVIEKRTSTGQNGAVWQLKHYEKYKSIEKLMEAYMKNSKANRAVHEWSV